MKRRSFWWMGLAAIALAASMVISQVWRMEGQPVSAQENSIPIAQEAPTPTEEAVPTAEDSPAALPLSGTYEDPQGNFQVGILEGYAVNTAAGSPLFQTTSGDLAYSVVRVPLGSDTPLSDIGLVDVAQQALGNGEGFQTQTFSAVPGGGLQIAWTGRFSQGSAPPQPVSGTILIKQQGAAAYLLVVAAFAKTADQVPAMVSTLVDTLQLL